MEWEAGRAQVGQEKGRAWVRRAGTMPHLYAMPSTCQEVWHIAYIKSAPSVFVEHLLCHLAAQVSTVDLDPQEFSVSLECRKANDKTEPLGL